MKKLDKKQIPQFIALCVLTAGLSGYVVMHLVAPGPVSAGTRLPAAPAAAHSAAEQPSAAGAAAKPGDTHTGGPQTGDAKSAEAGDPMDAPPPSAAMHDPFAVGYVDPKSLPAAPPAALKLPAAPALPKLPVAVKMAGIGKVGAMPVSFPGAPALPGGLSSFPATPAGTAPGLPAAPAAPALPAAPLWTVTGVLQGAAGKVAILRSGDARRIVRSGDFVDSTYRVTGVTRTSVTLRHGAVFYQLTLGGAKAAPASPGAYFTRPVAAPPSAAPAAPQPAPVPTQAAILGSTFVPVYQMARPKAALASLPRQSSGLNLASQSISVPRPAGLRSAKSEPKASPNQVANALALGLRLLDGSVPAENRK